MNKTLMKVLTVVGGLAVLIILVYLVIHAFGGAKSTSTATSTNPFGQTGLQGGQGTGTSQSGQVQIRSTSGQVFSVPDFTQNHQAVTETSGTYYYLTQDSSGNDQSSEYSIVYGTDSSISIGLLSEPLGASRLHAEAALRKFLSLSNAQLCTLNVTVMTPPSVNEQYAAENLGLSFCPNAVPLP